MISQKTIDAVRDLEVTQVIKRYGTDLKREGNSHVACCPFHNEKTPSFKVQHGKPFFKCFSCGEGGDGIAFVEKVKNLAFTEAVTSLAETFNIPIEYDESKENQEIQKRNSRVRDMAAINALAVEYFKELQPEPEQNWADAFGLDNLEAVIQDFDVCYSGEGWNGLLDYLNKKEADLQPALKMKLITEKKDKSGYVDFFRNRLMFPIRNVRGQVVGFGGRKLTEEANKKVPKYINSPESDIYNKSATLYGLFQAKDAIQKAGSAYLVEGYTDTIAMHVNGYRNTVASCGTSLTIGQAKLLKRYCSHVHILCDGDAAGRKAAQKDVAILLKAGLTCDIVGLPEGHDPESFLYSGNDLDSVWKADAVEERLNSFFENAETVPQRKEALDKCEAVLALLQSDTLRNEYVQSLKETQNLSGKIATDLARSASKVYQESEEYYWNEANKVKLPNGVDRKEFNRYGFFQVEDGDNTGIFYSGEDGKPKQQSNCTIRPLFHIYSQDSDQNTRILKINNGIETRVINPPSKSLINLQSFKEILFREGNFLFFGAAGHLVKLINFLAPRFPRAVQLNTLGYQSDGNFFAFADGIYTDRFIQAREDGMVEHKGEFYFLPAFSNIYSQIREGEDDVFEEDRKLKYRPSEITFSDYAQQCKLVFGDNGVWSICWFASAVFRSIIHSQLDFFPHLFLQGEKGSGKSALGWALSDIIYKKRMPFNLNHGTEAGFSGRLESDRDCIAWLEEYQNDLPEPRFQQLKAGYDGVGREKKNMSNLKKNKSDKVLNAMLIMGQYLPTRDDNSLYSRSLVLEVQKRFDYTAEERDAFAKIGKMREAGLSGALSELLQCRKAMQDNFGEAFHTTNGKLRQLLTEIGTRADERVLNNVAVVLATVTVLQNKVAFPVTLKDLEQMAVSAINRLSEQLDDTSSLANFWRIFEGLALKRTGNDSGETQFAIKEGQDYILAVQPKESAVTIQEGKGKTRKHDFAEETEVLYFNMRKLHGEYLKEHRQQFNEKGLQISDLRGYFRNAPGFIGSVKDISFSGKRTTAWAFRFNDVPMSLGRSERSSGDDSGNGNSEPSEPTGPTPEPVQATMNIPNGKVNGQVQDEYVDEDLPY